eukprot:GHRQ01039377.1.p2 GENE.GHRQ01039377.1~~GHRQ01039377.1.p2  ORF type:complete len:117 (-),score=14.35 GHRQ01039377.1:166-516(-)
MRPCRCWLHACARHVLLRISVPVLLPLLDGNGCMLAMTRCLLPLRLTHPCASSLPAPQWSIPNGIEISAECRDLLSRMLVRNPDERITMSEIHRHPWFIANLPVEVRRSARAACSR